MVIVSIPVVVQLLRDDRFLANLAFHSKVLVMLTLATICSDDLLRSSLLSFGPKKCKRTWSLESDTWLMQVR